MTIGPPRLPLRLLLLLQIAAESVAMTIHLGSSRFVPRLTLRLRTAAAWDASGALRQGALAPVQGGRRRRRYHRTPMTMMPEGPEVRTVVNQLQGAVGRTLDRIEFLSGRYSLLQNPPPGYVEFQARTAATADQSLPWSSRTIREWNCKGKFMYIILDSNQQPSWNGTAPSTETVQQWDDFQSSLWITLGMTGRFVNEATHLENLQRQRNSIKEENNHARWALVLISNETNETKRVYYYDPRSFGTLKFCLSKQELEAKLQSLGPDILHPSTTVSEFERILSASSTGLNICRFLMNQAKLSGVGNYILAEALYRARIDPFCTLREIHMVKDDRDPVASRHERLFAALQAVARESYHSQQPPVGGTCGSSGTGATNKHPDESFEMQCYGRRICAKGNKVIQDVNGPHGRTIWYTAEQLFMPLYERRSAVKSIEAEKATTNDLDFKSSDSAERLLRDLVEPSWKERLSDAIRGQSFKDLAEFIDAEYRRGITLYPPHDEIFTALNLCPLDKVKVVIIGQDPYHGPEQAHGLAFSVKRGVRPPPSLNNIMREAMEDVGIDQPAHGNLEHWARQGVLLLNAVLTVRRGEANSHAGKGWENFTDACIQTVNEAQEGVVFLLWGVPAAKKASAVDVQRHTIIRTSHPSPLGATKTASPFLGSHCFSRANAALEAHGKQPIDWSIL